MNTCATCGTPREKGVLLPGWCEKCQKQTGDSIEERMANIQAPAEELKAFAAGLRVGYKKGFEAGHAEGLMDAKEPKIELSATLDEFKKLKPVNKLKN